MRESRNESDRKNSKKLSEQSQHRSKPQPQSYPGRNTTDRGVQSKIPMTINPTSKVVPAGSPQLSRATTPEKVSNIRASSPETKQADHKPSVKPGNSVPASQKQSFKSDKAAPSTSPRSGPQPHTSERKSTAISKNSDGNANARIPRGASPTQNKSLQVDSRKLTGTSTASTSTPLTRLKQLGGHRPTPWASNVTSPPAIGKAHGHVPTHIVSAPSPSPAKKKGFFQFLKGIRTGRDKRTDEQSKSNDDHRSDISSEAVKQPRKEGAASGTRGSDGEVQRKNFEDLRKMLEHAAGHARQKYKLEDEATEQPYFKQSVPRDDDIEVDPLRTELSEERLKHLIRVHQRKNSRSPRRLTPPEAQFGGREKFFAVKGAGLDQHTDKLARMKILERRNDVMLTAIPTPKSLEFLDGVSEFNMYRRTDPLKFQTPHNLFRSYDVLDERGELLFHVGECHDRCFVTSTWSDYLPLYSRHGELLFFVAKRNQHKCNRKKNYYLNTVSIFPYIQADEIMQRQRSNVTDGPMTDPQAAFHVRLVDGGFLGHFVEMSTGIKNPYRFRIFDSAYQEVYQFREVDRSATNHPRSHQGEHARASTSKNLHTYVQIYHDHHPVGSIQSGVDLTKFGISQISQLMSYRATFPVEVPPIDKALLLALSSVVISHCEGVVTDKHFCLACCYLCLCRCDSQSQS